MDKSFDLQHWEMTGGKKKLRTTDIEEDSGIYDPFIPEGTTDGKRARNADIEEDSGIYDPSEGMTDGKRARNAGKLKALILKWISNPICITASYILNVIGVIAIIVLVVKLYEEKPCPICDPCVRFVCPESWLIHEGKYFYVPKNKTNWYTSSNICSSNNASLAVIATQEELDFFKKMLVSNHWFGLSKKDQVWRWPNGTEFTNQFPVGGEGFCAYVNGKGASSTKCSVEKGFVCSSPEVCREA